MFRSPSKRNNGIDQGVIRSLDGLGIFWRHACILMDIRNVFAADGTGESFGMARPRAACRLIKVSTEYSERRDRRALVIVPCFDPF